MLYPEIRAAIVAEEAKLHVPATSAEIDLLKEALIIAGNLLTAVASEL